MLEHKYNSCLIVILCGDIEFNSRPTLRFPKIHPILYRNQANANKVSNQDINIKNHLFDF